MISYFSEKSGRLPDTVFVVFSGPGLPNLHFRGFGRNQKEPRRKVTQIRGGITSRSAFFAHFVAVSVFDFSVIFEGPLPFPVSDSRKKCTIIITVNRSTVSYTHLTLPTIYSV